MSINWRPIAEFDDFSGDCTRYLVCDEFGYVLFGEYSVCFKNFYCDGDVMGIEEAAYFAKVDLPDEFV